MVEAAQIFLLFIAMPFDLLDPITAGGPSRTYELEEDVEGHLANNAERFVERPTVEVEDPSAVSRPLVVLAGTLGECLAPALVDLDVGIAGRISDSATSTSAIRMTRSGSGSGAAVVVADIAPERSVAWASEAFSVLKPTSVFVVSGIPGFKFVRGRLDAESTEHNVFCLRTGRSTQNPADAKLRCLPRGQPLDGLGAAVMLEAEYRGVPASAVIAVELNRSPDAGLVGAVGDALMRLMEQRSLSSDEASRVKKACANKYAASADLSVYV